LCLPLSPTRPRSGALVHSGPLAQGGGVGLSHLFLISSFSSPSPLPPPGPLRGPAPSEGGRDPGKGALGARVRPRAPSAGPRPGPLKGPAWGPSRLWRPSPYAPPPPPEKGTHTGPRILILGPSTLGALFLAGAIPFSLAHAPAHTPALGPSYTRALAHPHTLAPTRALVHSGPPPMAPSPLQGPSPFLSHTPLPTRRLGGPRTLGPPRPPPHLGALGPSYTRARAHTHMSDTHHTPATSTGAGVCTLSYTRTSPLTRPYRACPLPPPHPLSQKYLIFLCLSRLLGPSYTYTRALAQSAC
jgi:hypothetical protein